MLKSSNPSILPSVQLSDQLAATGERLFRGRSYLPLLLLPFFALTFLIDPPARVAPAGWRAICLAVALAGLAVRVWVTGSAPEGTSERSTTSIRAASLNTHGAYSLVRHPLYVANTLIALGLTLRSPSWAFPMIVVLLHVIYFERIAMAEERFLRRKFGAAFEAWAAEVPAIVPKSRAAFKRAPFSWRRAAGELHAWMVIAAGFFVADVLEASLVRHRVAVEARAWTMLAAGAVPFGLYALQKRWSRRK